MRALVTGGGGFLGRRIAEMLAERGDDVLVFGRHRYPFHEKAGIPTIQADLRDADAVVRACAGVDAVFHVGALTGVWGHARTFHDINVGGTRNVIDGCKRHDVGKLVFTSSPSVVFGTEDVCGVDESEPYSRKYLAVYPKTKAEAERMVLGADAPSMSTVAIRPHLVWGPGDPNLIPRVLARARAGRFIQVGDGKNLVDITYIDNAADAHLRAVDALAPGSPCAGRAFFISQGEPVAFWPWINGVLESVGVPRVTRAISYKTADRIGATLEFVYRCLRIKKEPIMTRFVASQLAKSHYFNISAARKDFGYDPRISTEEGVRRLATSILAESTE